MPAKIFKNPIEIGNRLEELSLKLQQLLEVIQAMVGARADCTPNDPPGSRGWSSWRMGTRRLREELLVEEDWERDETDQISGVLNKRRGLRIAVANTDDATGLEIKERFPQNRSKKGSATDRVVHANQGSFMEVLDASLNVVHLRPVAKPASPIITWYLCVYCEGDEFRAELSCPAGIDNGYFTDFVERILIVGEDDDGRGAAVKRRDDDNGGGNGSEFDIPVKRKKN